jgi:magnesium transporter
MLRAYGPGCDGSTIDAERQKIPDGATWIDLEEPTPAEEALVERCIKLDVPTEVDMEEIEPSSRLYERGGALYMTASALTGVTEGEPTTEPIAFVLTENRLVTVRYATPKSVRSFMQHVHHDPSLAADAMTALTRLLDAMIDRLADELEELGAEFEAISSIIFDKKIEARRIPVDTLTELLTRIGRAQTLCSRIRYSAVSTSRMLLFLSGSVRLAGEDGASGRVHLSSLMTDVTSLSEHATFLSDQFTFLLDAALGLIGIEQNAAMKLFSWAAIVFLPPTLIAGVYGMNFDYLPELKWHYGYFFALGAMLASAVLPWAYFKWRRWI